MIRFYDVLKQSSRAGQTPPLEESAQPAVNGRHISTATVIHGENAIGGTAPPERMPHEVSAESEVHAPQTTSQEEPFGVPAKVAWDHSARVIPNAADPVVVEHYRRLRTKLLQQHSAKEFRSLIVTSPGPNEGKTVTSVNLALSFAMLPSFKVLLVDGDLRRGSVGKWLGMSERPGLSNLIDGSATLEQAVTCFEDIPFQCISSGTSEQPQAELLHSSSQLRDLFKRMTDRFDLVVVDSPPVNVITDAQLLAAQCDAVLIVARAFHTTQKELEKAAQDLHPFRVIGCVLNGGTRGQTYRRYRGYY